MTYQATLPALIGLENIVEGNTKLASTDALAEIGGPALAGLLVQLISAPLAILFDAVSFAISAGSIALIRTPEEPPVLRAVGSTLWREVMEGWHLILWQPVLRAMAIGSTLQTFFGNFYAALYSVYVIRVVGLTPGVEGIIIAGGGVGGLLGALLAGQILGRANATSAFLAQLAAPLGALIGGMLGEHLGARAALTIAAFGLLVTALGMTRLALGSAPGTAS